VAYDNPIPGFKTRNCINLRLWAAKPSREFDLEAFNTGDYVQVGETVVEYHLRHKTQSCSSLQQFPCCQSSQHCGGAAESQQAGLHAGAHCWCWDGSCLCSWA
jgi:hypothetical protein